MNKAHDLFLIKLLAKAICDGDLLAFDGSIDPVHEGWYMCQYPRDTKGFFRWFEGAWWIDKDRWTLNSFSTFSELEDIFKYPDVKGDGFIDAATVLIPIGRPIRWHGLKYIA